MAEYELDFLSFMSALVHSLFPYHDPRAWKVGARGGVARDRALAIEECRTEADQSGEIGGKEIEQPGWSRVYITG